MLSPLSFFLSAPQYWISPFSWSIRSIAQSEFLSARYDQILPTGERRGHAFLRAWELSTDSAFRWGGIGVLCGYYLLLNCLSAWLLSGRRTWLAMGTKRTAGGHKKKHTPVEMKADALHQAIGDAPSATPAADSTATAAAGVHSIPMPPQLPHASSSSSAMPLERMSLLWRGVSYFVDAPGGSGGNQRQLLTAVDGMCGAGTLTALIGTSGAGKTTLLDALSRRVTSGTLAGEVLVNGVSVDKIGARFGRMVGYCTQQDTHLSTATVVECVRFSARLRLDASVSEERREEFVAEVLDLLELTTLAGRRVGDTTNPGLSPGQLKRLTIAVELVSNPSILFLDEPTSGLDSRAALHVMRVLKRVSATGRAIILTIHQASAELISYFDRLYLLHRGGTLVYSGPLGPEAVHVVNYFESLPLEAGMPPLRLPLRMNAATWVLDVIGSGTGAGGEASPWSRLDFAALYARSELRVRNEQEWQEMLRECLRERRGPTTTGSGADAEAEGGARSRPATSSTTLFARSSAYQFAQLLQRLWVSYYRDIGYNGTRFTVLLLSALVFGLLWLRVGEQDDSQAGVQSQLAALYFSFYYVSLFQSAAILPTMYKWKVVWQHEQRSRTYQPLLFVLAVPLVELPYLFAQSLLFALPFYFLCGFDPSAGPFFLFLALLLLVCMVLSAAGEFWALLVPEPGLAKIPQCFSFDLMFLMGGLLIQKDKIPEAWKFVSARKERERGQKKQCCCRALRGVSSRSWPATAPFA